jgi:hypothetical protein
VSSVLPHANATITEIVGAGFSEDYDAAAGDGEGKWVGSADAWLQERRQRSAGTDGRGDVILWRSLIIPGELADALSITEGDSITLRYRGELLTLSVRTIERRQPPPGVEPATIRLTMAEG